MEEAYPRKHDSGVSEDGQPTATRASGDPLECPGDGQGSKPSSAAQGVYYCSYIGVERLLRVIEPDMGMSMRTALLHPPPSKELPAKNRLTGGKSGMRQHDEMFFIKMHQVNELWFHQIIAELHSLIPIFRPPAHRGIKPEHSVFANAEIIVGRLTRVRGILKLLEPQITLMESLSPNSFLNFRDLLQGGSGFQSWQFRVLENIWGVEESLRQKVVEKKDGQSCDLSYREKLTKDRKRIESEPHALDEERLDWSKNPDNCLFVAVEAWLESLFDCLDHGGSNMPISDTNKSYWDKYCQLFGEHARLSDVPGWTDLHSELKKGFEEDFKKQNVSKQLSAKAKRGAVIVLANRGLPSMHIMNEILQLLLDVDNRLMGWRFKHREMVWRTIGHRHGTGQNVPGEGAVSPTAGGEEVTGVGYLRQTLRDGYRVYLSLTDLSTFLLPRITYTRGGNFRANFWPHCEEDLMRRLGKLQEGANEYFQDHLGLREFDKLQPRGKAD